MIIIGLDCSTTSTGVAVFEDGKLLESFRIKPKGKYWRERLTHEGPELKRVIKKYHPDKIYMEDVPLIKKQMETLVILGAVQGYVIGIASAQGVPIEFLMPSEWRSKIGLFGGKAKENKREEMKRKAIEKANEMFNLDLAWYSYSSTRNEDDVAEAVLIGYAGWLIEQQPLHEGTNKYKA
nr:MAG TPA: RuvC [Caudoviricetes sp.]